MQPMTVSTGFTYGCCLEAERRSLLAPRAESFLEGARIADRAISSGAALAKLQQLIQFTNARKHQASNSK